MFVDYAALQQAIAITPRQTGQVSPDYERDSVCLLLFDASKTMLLAIQKTDSEGYHWRDQIALPGGRIEPTDCGAHFAALRELREELGIEPSEVRVLGDLGHFQTATSRNDLEVVVGRWMFPSTVHADSREVARVFEIPLAYLLRLHLAQRSVCRAAADPSEHPVYPIPDTKIWGVTARILHHFLQVVLEHKDAILKEAPS